MSNLRYSTSPLSSSSSVAPAVRRPTIASPPAKKQKMSLTQTYMLATVARRQLQKEAARADHDLRLLVGHANLLDGLMLDLAHAEEEQESWFNQSVSTAAAAAASSEQSKHVSWADSHSIPEEVIEEDEEEYYEEDSDDESADEAVSIAQQAVRARLPVPPIDDEDDQEMDDDFTEELTLTRSPSHSASSSSSSSSSSLVSSTPSSPPELLHELDSESESESEDESFPSSPELPALDTIFSPTKQPSSAATKKSSLTPSSELALFDHESQQAIPIAAAC